MKLSKEEIEKIELRSEEVQEILTRPPKWIVRWGITIILVVIAMIIVGSWFFKYPTIISAEIVLTTENPPAPILAKITGKIQNLYIKNNERVLKDQIIGVIENPGDYNSVEELADKMLAFKVKFEPGETMLLNFKSYRLGDIQNSYSRFSKHLDDYNKTIRLNYHQRKVELYQNELDKYDHYLNNLKNQTGILKEELELTRKQYLRDSILFSQVLLSESDLEQSKSLLLSKEYSLEQNISSISNTEIQLENINQAILELKLQQEKLINEQITLIEESYENLLSAIESWKHDYVLISPTEGIVTFNEYWNENQTVRAGETVITIIPEDEGEIVGKVKLDFQGAGKVKNGQQANIQFANYPYMEFGMVKGVVKSISLAPSNNFYTLEIELPDGLKTFYGIDLDFKQEMQGTAEIITEDIRLIERIIRPLRFVLHKNTKFGAKK
ncbi:MAG: hypothetical protein C0597_12430 [Marinilabiliales bacterium]|nr:MAG: hypothetical protein C0597_12430 [Marinilabiliales bacterium]